MRRDRGQATVEFALALPLVAMLVLGIVQLVVVARDQLAVELAAREGARAAAVAADPASAGSAAAERSVDLTPIEVSVSESDGRVTVTVRYLSATNVPLIGLAIGDVEVAATVTMRREPP